MPPGQDEALIESVSFGLPPSHLAAVIGPSGCGKSTLLRLLVGILEPDDGRIIWSIPTEELQTDGHFAFGEVAYVPQFDFAHELLSVRECLEDALRLRLNCRAKEVRLRIRSILNATGLAGIADSRVKVLSGGQRRRLALAVELASDPRVLLCDEVASGLDPKAEREITDLLHTLAKIERRLVIHVTHSLAHIPLFDSVIVLMAGRLVFHAPPEYLMHYFRIEHPEELYPRLAMRRPEEWSASWVKHRAVYEKLMAGETATDVHIESPEVSGRLISDSPREPELVGRLKIRSNLERPAFEVGFEEDQNVSGATSDEMSAQPALSKSRFGELARYRVPGVVRQFRVLVQRRFLLFWRDAGGMALQVALALGFPLLVALFALDGLPQIRSLNMTLDIDLLQQLQEAYDYIVESTKTGSLVSGLVMLQVILLGLIGANNTAREIAADRPLIEKEKLAGLSPGADLAARVFFITSLVVVQSLWMAWFVDLLCNFPGKFALQVTVLLLVNGAITATSLAISSWSRTPERASLFSVYLVGFQLPLSGALLALPEFVGWLTRPFVASYWAWSGFLQTMRHTRHYDVAVQVSQTPLAPFEVCVWVLGCHILIALFFAWAGLLKRRWGD